jgi:hypothetical protein
LHTQSWGTSNCTLNAEGFTELKRKKNYLEGLDQNIIGANMKNILIFEDYSQLGRHGTLMKDVIASPKHMEY